MAERVRRPRPKITGNSGHRRSANVAAQQLPSARFTDCPIIPVVSPTEEVAELPRGPSGLPTSQMATDAGHTPLSQAGAAGLS
jgi:hypothetical protein